MTNTELINYLNSFKGQSVDSLINQLTINESENQEKEKTRAQNLIKWYKDLNGRYFLIKFNTFSFIVVKIENEFDSNITISQPSYNIYKAKNYFKIEFENRQINKFWLNNPFEEYHYEQNSTQVRELTEEEYGEYVRLYNDTKTLFNTINLDI